MAAAEKEKEVAVQQQQEEEEEAALLEVEDPLQEAEQRLEALYEIHDFFFSQEKEEKQRMLEEAMQVVLDLLEPVREGSSSSTVERARVFYLRGRALDALERYNPEAENCLTRAVKLDPSKVRYWNALGHCFWKKNDHRNATNCFTSALERERNKESLCQLSQVLRQMPASSNEERAQRIVESLALCKEAVQLDISDSNSWYVLGNTHYYHFFSVTHSVEDLKRSLSAYAMAERNGGGDWNPDLFFNRANVLTYMQRYDDAMDSYSRADELDPSLNGGEIVQAIRQFLIGLHQMVQRKGRVKPKRLQKIVDSLAAVTPEQAGVSVVEEPSGGDAAATTNGTGSGNNDGTHRPTPVAGTTPTTFRELAEAEDGAHSDEPLTGKYITMRILQPFRSFREPPECFLAVDTEGSVAVLAVYHLNEEAIHRLTAANVVLLDEPTVRKLVSHVWTDSETSGESKSTQSCEDNIVLVQAPYPHQLRVDGAFLPPGSFQPASLRVDTFDK